MNKCFRIFTALIASAFLASFTLGEETIVPDVVILNKYPVLSNDEMKQVSFKASIPENYIPKGVYWELHNPFRDKTIAGIVITVEYKLPSADKPTVLEMFIRADCGPLRSAGGQEGCFEAEQAIKASPIIKLKEVHYTPGNT